MCMEKWKDIDGYEGLYQINDKGEVKSLSRLSKRTLKQGEIFFTTKEIILTPRKSGNENRKTQYYMVALYDKDRKRKNHLIHRLVGNHFITPLIDGMVINHKDFNGLNNNVNNLEVVTQKENIIHYHSNDNELYNKEMLIKLHHIQKLSLREIARQFKTTHSTISNILKYYNIEIIKHRINQYV